MDIISVVGMLNVLCKVYVAEVVDDVVVVEKGYGLCMEPH